MMMDRSELALVSRMQADLVTLTDQTARQQVDLCQLAGTLAYLGDLLRSGAPDAADRACALIRATLAQMEHIND
jgi:hypothetical protein